MMVIRPTRDGWIVEDASRHPMTGIYHNSLESAIAERKKLSKTTAENVKQALRDLEES